MVESHIFLNDKHKITQPNYNILFVLLYARRSWIFGFQRGCSQETTKWLNDEVVPSLQPRQIPESEDPFRKDFLYDIVYVKLTIVLDISAAREARKINIMKRCQG